MVTGQGSSLGVLYRSTSKRTRALALGSAVAAFVAKIAIVLTAFGVVLADATVASVLGVIAGLAFAAQRILAGAARVGAECDVYRAASRAMLEGDVLAVPRTDPLRTLYEAGYHARQLLADTVPEVLANAFAALVVVPLLARELPGRVLVIAGAALAVVLVGALAVRRFSASFQERVVEAQAEVRDRTALAVEGRLELVAGAREEVVMRELERAMTRYRDVVGRASIASAFLGRAPLVAGAATVAAVVLVDGASREAVTGVLFGKALLLASALPILLGSILGTSELVRGMPAVRPLAELLASPRRSELGRSGGGRVELPAAIRGEGLAFAYDPAAAPAFEGVSLSWPPGEPLVVLGRNGAGKSTLLRLVLGLRDPSKGSLALADVSLREIDLVHLRRDVAYLPQRPYLGEPHVTVRQAIQMLEPDASDAAIESALDRVALRAALQGHAEAPLEIPVGELSAGQRQRLALARVLVRDAKLVLLDEPDANLDKAGVELVARLAVELAKGGTMVAIAAHTPELASLPGTRLTLA